MSPDGQVGRAAPIGSRRTLFGIHGSLALDHASRNRERAVHDLKELLRFASVSADPAHSHDISRCAHWIAENLRAMGLDCARVVSTRGHPFVYAEWRRSPGPTVLIYGHYDVQPAGPIAEWRSPPFAPQIRGGDLYARGASDDKGQLLAHVKAIDSYLRTSRMLPVNVRCVFDGEEEIGSPNLVRLLEARPRDFAADVAVVSDTMFLRPDRPAITASLRGLLGCEVTIRRAGHDLHAGHYGGAVLNPLEILCEVVDGLHDAEGRVAIEGFYDRTRPREALKVSEQGLTDAEILRSAGVPGGWGEPGFSEYERVTIRPALTVTSITSDDRAGADTGARIPVKATASLDVRLVPEQSPTDIEQRLRRHVMAASPASVGVSVTPMVRVPPVSMAHRHPSIAAASRAYLRGFGVSPTLVGSGGSIPVVSAIRRSLGIPVVLMGFGLPGDNIHAPNERFHLANLFKGIDTAIAFLEELRSDDRR